MIPTRRPASHRGGTTASELKTPSFFEFFYFSYVFKPPKPVFKVKISKKGLACPRSKDLKGKLLFVKPLVRFGSLTGP